MSPRGTEPFLLNLGAPPHPPSGIRSERLPAEVRASGALRAAHRQPCTVASALPFLGQGKRLLLRLLFGPRESTPAATPAEEAVRLSGQAAPLLLGAAGRRGPEAWAGSGAPQQLRELLPMALQSPSCLLRESLSGAVGSGHEPVCGPLSRPLWPWAQEQLRQGRSALHFEPVPVCTDPDLVRPAGGGSHRSPVHRAFTGWCWGLKSCVK